MVIGPFPALFAFATIIGCARRGPEPKRILPTAPAEPQPMRIEPEVVQVHHEAQGFRQGVWSGNKVLTTPEAQWTKSLRGPIVHPLSLCDDFIYAVGGGSLYKFTPAGETVWEARIQADGPTTCVPRGILVPAGAGVMNLIDYETGERLSSYGGYESIRTPALPLGGEWAWVERDGVLLTKDSQNGPMLQGPVGDAASDGDTLIIGNMHGIVAAINETGVKWQVKAPGPVTGQPIIRDNVVYVPFGPKPPSSGGMLAISTSSGAAVWTSRFGPGTSAPPSIGEFIVVPSRDGDLVALDPVHGGTRWRTPRTVKITTKPVIVADGIYVGDGLGRVQAFDMVDGGGVWTLELGSPITGDPVILDGLLVVGTADGRLVALR